MLIALYVDDSLIAGNGATVVVWIKGELHQRFEMKELGEARACLGLEFSLDRGNRTLKLSQEKYTWNARPAATLVESGFNNIRGETLTSRQPDVPNDTYQT